MPEPAPGQVGLTSPGVDDVVLVGTQSAIRVEAMGGNRHGVDGEVTAREILLQADI